MVTAMKRRADAGPILATALLVCAAYYVGANVGFILRFPPATPSVLWPPNSILTATLLLSPPRRWGIYLLAAFPAHLVAELGAEWPVSLVLTLFVTNCRASLQLVTKSVSTSETGHSAPSSATRCAGNAASR